MAAKNEYRVRITSRSCWHRLSRRERIAGFERWASPWFCFDFEGKVCWWREYLTASGQRRRVAGVCWLAPGTRLDAWITEPDAC